MAQTVRPLGNRVLVRAIKQKRESPGGVVLPDGVREQSDRGEVLAVGPGVPIEGSPPMMLLPATTAEIGERLPEIPAPKPIPMIRPIVGIEVGDVVLFSPYAGSKVTLDGDDFLLLVESDVLGAVEGEPDE